MSSRKFLVAIACFGMLILAATLVWAFRVGLVNDIYHIVTGDYVEESEEAYEGNANLLSWDSITSPEYYSVIDTADVDYDLQPGDFHYCERDELKRSLCAVGVLTSETRLEAAYRDRFEISHLKPSGWGNNFRTTIPSTNGSKDYSGWFWNRSHLIADSLGGSPFNENMITGTRPQNVGNSDNQGGMAYPETVARNYLDSPAAQSCPLYYEVTPNYQADELIPRSVTVDIQSCDKGINEKVLVYNAASGFNIDYTSGIATQASR